MKLDIFYFWFVVLRALYLVLKEKCYPIEVWITTESQATVVVTNFNLNYKTMWIIVYIMLYHYIK